MGREVVRWYLMGREVVRWYLMGREVVRVFDGTRIDGI